MRMSAPIEVNWNENKSSHKPFHQSICETKGNSEIGKLEAIIALLSN